MTEGDAVSLPEDLEKAIAERDEYREHYETMRSRWDATQQQWDSLNRAVERLRREQLESQQPKLFEDVI